MKSSFPYSRGNKYQTYCDGKSNTAKPTAPDLSGRLNNYLYPRYHGNNQIIGTLQQTGGIPYISLAKW